MVQLVVGRVCMVVAHRCHGVWVVDVVDVGGVAGLDRRLLLSMDDQCNGQLILLVRVGGDV